VVIYIQDMKSYVEYASNKIKSISPVATNVASVDDSDPTNASRLKTNAVFIGFADEDSIKFDQSSRTVSLEGRDYTSLFVDVPYNDPKTIPVTAPLDYVIIKILLSRTATKDIRIFKDPSLGELPILSKFYSDFNPLSGQKSRRKNETYWDVIQDLARKAGVLIYIQLDLLIITKPNALYNRKKMKQFIWGKNLKDLEFKRNLGRTKDFNIGVRSLNTRKKEVYEAIIPQDGKPEWAAKTGIPLKKVTVKKLQPDKSVKEEDAKVIFFRLPNISDRDQLIEIGQGIFEEMNRQQIEGSLSTKDMLVAEGDARVDGAGVPFDVTKIRNATPIDLRIFEDDLDAIKELNKNQQGNISREATVAARQKYLEDRHYEPKVAAAFAQTMGKFDTPFYTRSVDFKFDMSNGFEMKLDFINFVELPQSLISR